MKKFFRNFMVACALAIMLACTLGLFGCGGLDWPSGPLAQLIPEVDGAKVTEIYSDDEDYLSFSFETEQEDYKTFIDGVKSAGFTIEPESGSSSYNAYDASGNLFHAYFSSSDEEVDVKITAPETLSTISWPTTGLSQQIPTPEFTKGKIGTDKSSKFSITIEMSKDDYSDYVNKLIEAGYDSDYSKSEKSFSATNASGYKVKCSYEGNGRVYISVEPLVEEDETETTTEAATTEATTTAAASIGDTDLRELADDYEDLVDRYIAFMEDYDPTDYSKLSEYTSILAEYTEFANKVSSIDTSKYSVSDAAYFAEVTARCAQKVADAGIY